jgi:sigma54-dependent transcription regulator
MNSQSQSGFGDTETTDLVTAVGLNRPYDFQEVMGKYAFALSRVFNADKTGVFLVHVRSTTLFVRV